MLIKQQVRMLCRLHVRLALHAYAVPLACTALAYLTPDQNFAVAQQLRQLR
jgi:hypothetical protein